MKPRGKPFKKGHKPKALFKKGHKIRLEGRKR